MKYLIGRNNLAATIYVPYDCGNNCPFCTSKQMYKNLEPNLELLWKNLKLINRTSSIQDVVLTGGEPFANLEVLQQIIDKISCDKDVYINTTLPFVTQEKQSKIIQFLRKNRTKINCLNISRHINYQTKNDTNDNFINDLPVPFRINCVLYNANLISKDNALSFIKRWPKARNICFRADYRFIDQTNLKTLNHPFIQFLTNELNAEYENGGGCQVCNTDNFLLSLDGELYKLSFHRGTEFSSIKIGDRVVINDIILMPDSHMYYDWDFKRPTEPGKKMLDVLKDLGYNYFCRYATNSESVYGRNRGYCGFYDAYGGHGCL